jgi:hypothetical protein
MIGWSSVFASLFAGRTSLEYTFWSKPLQDSFYSLTNDRQDALFLQYLDKPSTWKKGERFSMHYCNTTWRDPMQDTLNSLRSLLFRTLIALPQTPPSAYNSTPFFRDTHLQVYPDYPFDDPPPYTWSPASNWTQLTPYTGTRTTTVYRTSTPYLVSAFLVSLLGVAAVLPLYSGWWELGRTVSFNPLEVGKAYDAILLSRVDGNGKHGDLIGEVGDTRVQYGVIDDDGDRARRASNSEQVSRMGKRLMFAEETVVRRPVRGEVFVG